MGTHLPCKLVTTFRLLGVTFGDRFSFQEEYGRILSLAKKRIAIVARAAGLPWGLETNILRLTCDALVVSSLRYGLAVAWIRVFST